jgi:hypothetical protein
MEDAVKASSWKPSSPIMTAAHSESIPNDDITTPSVAMRAMTGQQVSNSYWSPSTQVTGGSAPSSGEDGGSGSGQSNNEGTLALNAREFVPGGGDSGGVVEFVPSSINIQQQHQQHQQQQHHQQQQQQDGRMYDRLLQEQNGATYSETPLIQPAPKKKTIGSFFMSDRLQERYQHLNECTLRELQPQDPKIKLIPTGYTSIYPLDPPGRDDSATAGSFGYP